LTDEKSVRGSDEAPPGGPQGPGQRLSVAVETPQHAGLGGVLDYLAAQPWPAGMLVRCPLGRRTVPGIVWGQAAGSDTRAERLRELAEVMDSLPPLPPSWRALVDFAAGYYQRGTGELALSVLPPELRKLTAVQVAKRVARLQKSPPVAPGGPLPLWPELSAEQTAVLDGMPAEGPVLLHGATGSGKTEVYLRAADRALQAGRQVLVLVPEINLTPQLEARFAQRFPDRVLVALHSGLTPAQRLKHWLMAHLGMADLVLGTRLAVFTPLPRPGLIVVDEEHDPSFKQQEGARYSARDLAVYRGRLERLPVVLGSATPSLESWQRSLEGRYRRLSMPTRIGGGVMPEVRLLDMSQQPRERGENAPALAAPLLQAIEERIARGEQSLLLLNRRGYAPVLHCGACSWKSQCPHCSAWRVFHKLDRTLRCHHCGFTERVPRACPECGNLDIAPVGRGTEKLEEQMAALLPGARVARIDADTTRTKGSLDAQLAAVHDGDVDVLVGTQMVAKGHDFRRITLVAAVNPDGALFASDFRAAERLFALLLQAAGRAGRDAQAASRSQMWLQTWHPQHPLYAALKRHDYEAFAAGQLEERCSAGLPPFSHLALLRAEGRTPQDARAFVEAAAALADGLEGAAAVTLYPAVPPPVARVADVERMQMLLESSSRAALQRLLSAWTPLLHAMRAEHKGVLRWAVDVDPLGI
jgi:primosomal protein N' (replication factor Y) (superfamily II helicase)